MGATAPVQPTNAKRSFTKLPHPWSRGPEDVSPAREFVTHSPRGLPPPAVKRCVFALVPVKYATTCCAAGASPRPTLWVKRYFFFRKPICTAIVCRIPVLIGSPGSCGRKRLPAVPFGPPAAEGDIWTADHASWLIGVCRCLSHEHYSRAISCSTVRSDKPTFFREHPFCT